MPNTSKHLHKYAKRGRYNGTNAEKEAVKVIKRHLRNHCWLKKREVRKIIKRQVILCNKYIADFYLKQYKVVIEIDGSHHTKEPQKSYDEERTRLIKKMNIRVIRFTNEQVFNGTMGKLLHFSL